MNMPKQQPAHLSEAFHLYKANSPFDGQSCFTDYLNEQLALGQPLSHLWASKAEELDSLIWRSPIQETAMLYRATLDGYVNRFISGDSELIYPAFMSTSDDESSIQRHFSTPHRNISAALLKIECPAGTPALDMEADTSFGGHEREFLLPRNSIFEVISMYETTERHEMAQIMSSFYATSYSSLKVYNLKFKKNGACSTFVATQT